MPLPKNNSSLHTCSRIYFHGARSVHSRHEIWRKYPLAIATMVYRNLDPHPPKKRIHASIRHPQNTLTCFFQRSLRHLGKMMVQTKFAEKRTQQHTTWWLQRCCDVINENINNMRNHHPNRKVLKYGSGGWVAE